MPALRIRLVPWLIALGWILVVGAAIELLDLLFHHHWPHPWWERHSLLYELIDGPVTHLGLGVALFALARR